jgi:hypothetical protein
MKTNKFLKGLKEVKKTGVNDVLNSIIRSGSAVGAGIGSNFLGQKLSPKVPIITKIKGPALMGLGLLGEVFLGNEKAKAVAAGISTWGALETTHMLLPDAQKELLSFDSGVTVVPTDPPAPDPNATNPATNGMGNAEDWNNAYKQAEAAANADKGTNGVDDNFDASKAV